MLVAHFASQTFNYLSFVLVPKSVTIEVNLSELKVNFHLILTVLLLSQHVLDRWFESEPLKATLATDAVIGAMTSPKKPGSGCVTNNGVCY